MPAVQPSRGDVHVNRPLTNISLAFVQDEANFVADEVFPAIQVSKRSDVYFTYDRGEFNRDEMKERAPATESAGSTYTIGQDTYFTRTRAIHRDVPDEVRDNQDDPIDLDREATIFVTQKELINREVNWVNRYFLDVDPGVLWTFKVQGAGTRSSPFDPTSAGDNNVVGWSSDSSTPIEDVREGKRFVLESTGFMPNTMTISRPVFDRLLDHPDIVGRLDRGQTTGPAIVMRQNLAELFELDRILVMDAIQNLSEQGAAPVHQFIGNSNALLTYRPPAPGIMTPSAGYTMAWTGRFGATPMGTRIKRFRIEKIDADRIEIESFYDQKLVAPDLGYMFGNILDDGT